MKKIVTSIIAASAIVLQVQATTKTEYGDFSGQVKAMHILSDNENSFAPNDGSGYLLTGKYLSPELTTGLKLGAALYVNGDTGLTDWDAEKNALGMFTDEEGKAKVHLGQAYLQYNNDKVSAKVGRQILNTPLTTIKWSLMPNFYEAAVVGGSVAKDTSLTLAHVSSMSYGSRAAADFGLIGEKTGTAGTARPMYTQSAASGVKQATFTNLGELAGTDDTSGITAINVAYTGIKNLKLSLWDYYAHDIGNMIYADAAYKMPVSKGLKMSVNAQYLSQSLDGASDDYSLIGTKVKVGNKKYSAYLAYSMSGADAKFVNPWGSDPSYTSSLFSRNQYRQDVSAYKLGGHYVIMKGLKLMVSHANYGQSKTTGWGPANLTAQTDATETDIILAYKPNKQSVIKIFNAMRVSEYSTTANEKEMNHIRVIGAYNF